MKDAGEKQMEEYLRVGVVTSTHGLNGEVKVFPTTDDPKRFKQLKEVLAVNGKEKKLLHPCSARFFKQYVILKFEEYQNINEVEYLPKAELYVDRAHAVKLEKNEHFIVDLIGMTVVEKDTKEVLGTLTDILQTAANDVYVVDYHGRELLLPSIPECILDIDMEKREIMVHLMEGLLD